MDHIPFRAPVQVAFRAENKKYKPGEFFTITESYIKDHRLASLDDLIDKGFTDDSKDERLRSKWTRQKLNHLVQSWLLFALLAQVIGGEVDASKFRIASNNLLTTTRLSGVLQGWSAQRSDAAEGTEPKDVSKQKNGYVQASMALEFARSFCRKHLAYRPHEEDDYGRELSPRKLRPPHDGLDSSMILSIMSVGEILQDELWTRLPPRQKDRVEFWKQPQEEERNWGYSRWCRERMRELGWCPSEIRRTEGTMAHVNVIYYATLMDKPPEDHGLCTTWDCKAEEKRFESLEPLHLHGGGSDSCGHPLGPSMVDFGDTTLEDIIDANLIPLVRYTIDGKLQCRGHNLNVDSPITFGAVSHTWVDKIVDSGVTPAGQNNRSMLQCQVERLRKDLTAIFDNNEADEQHRVSRNGSSHDHNPKSWKEKEHQDGEHPWFWVDILCFPHDWERQARLVNRLHTIYEKAAAVLIWDRTLLNKSEPAPSHYIETIMLLNIGQWSKRLWTLPEAVLAKNLHVCFKDSFVALNDLENASELARADNHNPNHFIWKAGRLFTSSISHIRAQLHNHDHAITQLSSESTFPVQSVWRALQFREASMPQDQFTVAASVLGLDVSRFLENESQSSRSGSELYGEDAENTGDSGSKMVEFLNALDETPKLGIPSGLIFLPPPKLSEKGYGWAPKTWLSKQLYTYPLFRPLQKTGYMMPHGLHVEFPGLFLHCPDPVISKKDLWVPVSQTLIKWFKIEIDAAGTSIEKLAKGLDPRHEHCVILNAAKTRERWEAGLFVKRNGLLACGEVWRAQPICRVWVRLETRASKIQLLRKKFYEDAQSQYFGERIDNQRWCIEDPLSQYSK